LARAARPLKDDPHTDRELAFRRMLQNPAELAAWAAGVREQWERARGVEWLHGYRDGVQVWRPRRPPPDLDHSPQFRFNPKRAAHYAAKLAAAKSGASISDATRADTHPASG
jgi:hypothetical protein